MFIQDDYSALKNINTRTDPGFMKIGLGKEPSVTNFVIYDVAILRSRYALPAPTPIDYYETLRKAKSVYVSSYTGDLISSD